MKDQDESAWYKNDSNLQHYQLHENAAEWFYGAIGGVAVFVALNLFFVATYTLEPSGRQIAIVALVTALAALFFPLLQKDGESHRRRITRSMLLSFCVFSFLRGVRLGGWTITAATLAFIIGEWAAACLRREKEEGNE